MSDEKTLSEIAQNHAHRMEQIAQACKQMRQEFELLIALAQLYKPNDRGEVDRYYAIWITELEKAYAFYKTYLHVEEA